jgi:hypothetical protein
MFRALRPTVAGETVMSRFCIGLHAASRQLWHSPLWSAVLLIVLALAVTIGMAVLLARALAPTGSQTALFDALTAGVLAAGGAATLRINVLRHEQQERRQDQEKRAATQSLLHEWAKDLPDPNMAIPTWAAMRQFLRDDPLLAPSIVAIACGEIKKNVGREVAQCLRKALDDPLPREFSDGVIDLASLLLPEDKRLYLSGMRIPAGWSLDLSDSSIDGGLNLRAIRLAGDAVISGEIGGSLLLEACSTDSNVNRPAVAVTLRPQHELEDGGEQVLPAIVYLGSMDGIQLDLKQEDRSSKIVIDCTQSCFWRDVGAELVLGEQPDVDLANLNLHSSTLALDLSSASSMEGVLLASLGLYDRSMLILKGANMSDGVLDLGVLRVEKNCELRFDDCRMGGAKIVLKQSPEVVFDGTCAFIRPVFEYGVRRIELSEPIEALSVSGARKDSVKWDVESSEPPGLSIAVASGDGPGFWRLRRLAMSAWELTVD